MPEHAYTPNYDESGHMEVIAALDHKRQWRAQIGMRERMLCGTCEAFLNENYESRFKRLWFDERPLDVLEARDAALLWMPEPERFKLYHLSILLRADLSQRPEWSNVNLDPRHRARLVEMVRDGDAGHPYEFPVACCAIRRSATDPSIWWDNVASPLAAELDGVRVYHFTFGGCSWWYFDTRHPIPEVEKITLRPDGRLPVIKREWKALDYYALHSRIDAAARSGESGE